MRYTVKKYDEASISVYDSEAMTYQFIEMDNEHNRILLQDIADYLNSCDSELKLCEAELDKLKKYMGKDKHDLVLENLKLRSMLKYQEGMYNLEKRYFRDVLDSLILEYPESAGLLDFKTVMGW